MSIQINLWGVIEQEVHSHDRRFWIIQKFKQQVEQRFYSLQPHILQTQLRSLRNRICKNIQRNGKKFELKKILKKSINFGTTNFFFFSKNFLKNLY